MQWAAIGHTVLPDTWGRIDMHRDMELVRKIVRAVQAKNDLSAASIDVDGYEEWFIQRHLELLLNAGMIEGVISKPLGVSHPLVMVRDLTNAGHDFAAALQNDTVWAHIKSKFTGAELAGLPLALVKELGVKAVSAWALGKLGLS
jgi:hypothetical protein